MILPTSEIDVDRIKRKFTGVLYDDIEKRLEIIKKAMAKLAIDSTDQFNNLFKLNSL